MKEIPRLLWVTQPIFHNVDHQRKEISNSRNLSSNHYCPKEFITACRKFVTRKIVLWKQLQFSSQCFAKVEDTGSLLQVHHTTWFTLFKLVVFPWWRRRGLFSSLQCARSGTLRLWIIKTRWSVCLTLIVRTSCFAILDSADTCIAKKRNDWTILTGQADMGCNRKLNAVQQVLLLSYLPALCSKLQAKKITKAKCGTFFSVNGTVYMHCFCVLGRISCCLGQKFEP